MTQQPKHTPGPWLLKHGPNHADASIYALTEVNKNHFGIASVYQGYAEQEANAHLIAAAPEMLEALEGLSRWVAKGIENGAFDNTVGNAVADYNRANAIIRKAKGE